MYKGDLVEEYSWWCPCGTLNDKGEYVCRVCGGSGEE